MFSETLFKRTVALGVHVYMSITHTSMDSTHGVSSVLTFVTKGFSTSKKQVFHNSVTFLHCEGSEELEQVAQRGCGCPIPGSVQGQAGWGFEQPGLVEGVPAHGWVVGTR